MIFHIGNDLPTAETRELDASSPVLTSEETRILKNQIRKNRTLIHDYIRRIDLFVNQERYPHQVAFVAKIRARLFLLMDENDTFRKVLWKHLQQETIGMRDL